MNTSLTDEYVDFVADIKKLFDFDNYSIDWIRMSALLFVSLLIIFISSYFDMELNTKRNCGGM